MNFDKIYNGILENFDISEGYLSDILTTLEFRLKKNHYSYDNIKSYVESSDLEDYDLIYFESENLIVNIRSTVDILLQLVNVSYRMNYSDLDINIKNIIKNTKCTVAVKDVFLLHTHPKNQFWDFIYKTRNEIVHESCIKTQLPLMFEEEYRYGRLEYKAKFVNKAGDKEDLLYFYNQCIKLIDELCDGVLNVLSKGLY